MFPYCILIYAYNRSGVGRGTIRDRRIGMNNELDKIGIKNVIRETVGGLPEEVLADVAKKADSIERDLSTSNDLINKFYSLFAWKNDDFALKQSFYFVTAFVVTARFLEQYLEKFNSFILRNIGKNTDDVGSDIKQLSLFQDELEDKADDFSYLFDQIFIKDLPTIENNLRCLGARSFEEVSILSNMAGYYSNLFDCCQDEDDMEKYFAESLSGLNKKLQSERRLNPYCEIRYSWAQKRSQKIITVKEPNKEIRLSENTESKYEEISIRSWHNITKRRNLDNEDFVDAQIDEKMPC